MEWRGETNIHDNNIIGEDKLFNFEKLKEIWKPLLLSMKFLGITYGDLLEPYRSQSNSVEPENFNQKAWTKNPSKMKHTFGVFLCLSVLFALIAFCVLNARELVLVTGILSVEARLVVFTWLILCTCQQLTCLLTTKYRTKTKPLTRFQKFAKSLLLVKAQGISQHKKRIRVAVGVGWLCIIFNAIVLMFSLYANNDAMRKGTRMMYFGSTNWTKVNTDAITFSYTAAHLFISGCWVIPTCFYVCLSQFVTGCFNDLFDRTAQVISERKPLNLVRVRREYVTLCHVLSTLDEVLSPLGIVTFAIYIPQVVLNINGCINTFSAGDIMTGVAFTFWITSSFVILLMISIAGAQVNNAACRLTEILYDIDASQLDKRSEIELMLLLSNVSSNHARLTVGGVVTINKEMIITIFGTIIGYVTLLIQFK